MRLQKLFIIKAYSVSVGPCCTSQLKQPFSIMTASENMKIDEKLNCHMTKHKKLWMVLTNLSCTNIQQYLVLLYPSEHNRLKFPPFWERRRFFVTTHGPGNHLVYVVSPVYREFNELLNLYDVYTCDFNFWSLILVRS